MAAGAAATILARLETSVKAVRKEYQSSLAAGHGQAQAQAQAQLYGDGGGVPRPLIDGSPNVLHLCNVIEEAFR